jgi:DNA-binding NarL/FixJ family response regulator
LIVEDQPAARKDLQMLLAAETDFSVIGEATDGQAALDLTTSLRPDVVLMDVETPRMDGIATTCELRLVQPHAAVIILSVRDDALSRARAKDAAAFVAKSMPEETLLATIRQVAHLGCPPVSGEQRLSQRPCPQTRCCGRFGWSPNSRAIYRGKEAPLIAGSTDRSFS